MMLNVHHLPQSAIFAHHTEVVFVARRYERHEVGAVDPDIASLQALVGAPRYVVFVASRLEPIPCT